MAAISPQPALRGADLLGTWRFQRDISDLEGNLTARAEGILTLSLTGKDGLWEEQGTLQLDASPPMKATRRYRFLLVPEGLQMFFEDGRDFHTITFSEPVASAEHLCAADLYRVAYDFTTWPNWSANWRVTGPAKSYAMLTHYMRT